MQACASHSPIHSHAKALVHEMDLAGLSSGHTRAPEGYRAGTGVNAIFCWSLYGFMCRVDVESTLYASMEMQLLPQADIDIEIAAVYTNNATCLLSN